MALFTLGKFASLLARIRRLDSSAIASQHLLVAGVGLFSDFLPPLKPGFFIEHWLCCSVGTLACLDNNLVFLLTGATFLCLGILQNFYIISLSSKCLFCLSQELVSFHLNGVSVRMYLELAELFV